MLAGSVALLGLERSDIIFTGLTPPTSAELFNVDHFYGDETAPMKSSQRIA
jgi:hypothetical protein